jgi:hypothetical protein
MASTNTMSILSTKFFPDLLGIINDYLMPSKDEIKNNILGVQDTMDKISKKIGQDNAHKLRVNENHRRGWATRDEKHSNDYYKNIHVTSNLSPNACIMLDRQINSQLHNVLSETFYKKIYKTPRKPISGFDVFCHQERPGFKYVDWCGDKMRHKLLKKWNSLDESDRDTYKLYKYCRYKRRYE